MNRPEITLILARSANGVVGADGRMPWHLPADLRRFTSPEHFVEVRARFGGPAEASLIRSLDGYRERLGVLESRLAVAIGRRVEAREELDRLSRALVA